MKAHTARKSKRLILSALTAALSACGGGSSGGDALQAPESSPVVQTAPLAVKPTRIVFYGNSVTKAVGWIYDWGMAVRSPELDYAHVTAAALALPYEIRAYAGEAGSDDEKVTAFGATITPSTIAVIQLAENIDITGSFAPTLKRFALAAKSADRVICVGTWWPSDPRDALVKDACAAVKGVFVDVSDLKTSPKNPDAALPAFGDVGVDEHPKNWGMSQIAARVVEAATR